MDLEKKKFEMLGTLDDTLFVLGSALRYGIRRRTYATGLISGFLIDNLGLCNEKWIVNFWRDILEYERDRIDGSSIEEYHHEDWMRLKKALQDIAAERGYRLPTDWRQ